MNSLDSAVESKSSPFQQAALSFALNNSPSGAFKVLLSNVGSQSYSSIDTNPLTASASNEKPACDASFVFAPTPSSSSGSSVIDAVQSAATTFDGLFRVPQLPSMRRFSGCNFCGALASQQDNGPLMQCEGCKTTLYCSQEHKNFDWKRHKPMCRTFQMRVSRSTQSLQSTSSQQAEAMDTLSSPIRPAAVRPPMDQPMHEFLSNSTSTSSIYSSKAGSSSGVSELSAAAPSNKPLQHSSSNQSMDSAIDPDIQIIESSSSSPRKPRKRPLDANENFDDADSKIWKDHSKNLLFKTTLQDHMKTLAASGMALNQHQAVALRLRYIAEHVIRSLNEYGWAVVDNFLGKTHCRYTYAEVEELYKRGLFKEGQLIDRRDPTDAPSTTAKDIRSDKIYWFDSSEFRARDAVTIRLLISMIDSVIVHFAKRIPPYAIGGRSRAMIACYPGNGTRYIKHVDNPIRDGRCITSIYYCNENWMLSEDGGILRLYPETSQVPMDIDPQADRLVFFWSDHRNPHEVLPVFRHRYAITIWYFDEAEKLEALERQKRDEANEELKSSKITTNEASPSLFKANINSAPIPQKRKLRIGFTKTVPHLADSPFIPQLPKSNTSKPKFSPAIQWRNSNRLSDKDCQSQSTRSILDDEEVNENQAINPEGEDHNSGLYVFNFEV